jgi:hypothetical protein
VLVVKEILVYLISYRWKTANREIGVPGGKNLENAGNGELFHNIYSRISGVSWVFLVGEKSKCCFLDDYGVF